MTDAGMLAALAALQARFVGAVRAGDWPAAQELERQRFALLDALAREAPLPAPVARELAAILRADRELRPQVEAALADTTAALRELRLGRDAAGAYGAAAP